MIKTSFKPLTENILLVATSTEFTNSEFTNSDFGWNDEDEIAEKEEQISKAKREEEEWQRFAENYLAFTNFALELLGVTKDEEIFYHKYPECICELEPEYLAEICGEYDCGQEEYEFSDEEELYLAMIAYEMLSEEVIEEVSEKDLKHFFKHPNRNLNKVR